MDSVGLYAELACIWDVMARNPGTVHRNRDFDDVCLSDFLASAAAIAPILGRAHSQPVGTTILEAVEATRKVVRCNTNIGIILLLVPLAIPAAEEDLRAGVERVLSCLDLADARDVFAAIRLAEPAGLGDMDEEDVRHEPTRPLREIMALAADRDLDARQYADCFHEIFDEGVPDLQQGLDRFGSLEFAIVFTHLQFMARYPDSLIQRKLGRAEAEESARRAAAVLDAGWPDQTAGRQAFSEFDLWLLDGERGRTPGTTADLVTASLFVALRQGIITLPPPWPWSVERDEFRST